MTRKLCFVLPAHWEAFMGGSQYQAKLLIERLVEGYDVDVYFLTCRAKEGFKSDRYQIVKFSALDGIRRYGQFFDARRLYRALARIRPDIVYQQVGNAHTGISAFYARRAGARMVWRVSSDRSVSRPRLAWWRIHHRIEQWILEYGIRRADLILAQTVRQKAELARNYGRTDAIVVPNFHPETPPCGPKDRRRKQVVWIANLKPLKNPAAFVRLALGYTDRDDIRFVMIGAMTERGPWGEDVARLIRTAPNVRYLGACTQEQVMAELAAAHVLVNTSDYEGFSNTFIQAWLCRVPVLGLHVDPDGLLSDGGLGCVSHDEQRLAADLRRFLDDDELRERTGERCRRHAVRQHSMANCERIAQLLELEPLEARRSSIDACGVPRSASM